jgi:hypothetical protein
LLISLPNIRENLGFAEALEPMGEKRELRVTSPLWQGFEIRPGVESLLPGLNPPETQNNSKNQPKFRLGRNVIPNKDQGCLYGHVQKFPEKFRGKSNTMLHCEDKGLPETAGYRVDMFEFIILIFIGSDD